MLHDEASSTVILLRHAREAGADGHLLKYACSRDAHVHLFLRGGRESEDLLARLGAGCRVTLIERLNERSGRLKYWRAVAGALESSGARPKTVVGGSLEQAAILEFKFPNAKNKYYLFSDITRFHMSKYWGYGIRALERWLLNRGWIPCITSPGFHEVYLRHLGVHVNPILIHNVEPALVHRLEASSENYGRFPTIGWFGLLRCNRSVEILYELCSAKQVSLLLAGKAASLVEERFEKLLSLPNVNYVGTYTADQLPELYSKVHLTWACDWSSGEIERNFDNSSALLPNRLYQGISARTPLIASAESWVGNIISHYTIGVEVQPNRESVTLALSQLEDQRPAFLRKLDSIRFLPLFAKNPWIDVLNGHSRRMSEMRDSREVFL